MAVVVIDTIKPKNNGTFPVVEAADVKVTNDKRLDAALNDKANQSDLNALSNTVSGKASQSDLNALSTTVAGKQNALTEDQLTAVNSGITSELVTQIGTNTTAIAGKANTSALDLTNAAVATKADATDTAASIAGLQSQIDAIVTPVTQDAEVENARVDAAGVTHVSLKDRLDDEIIAVQDDVSELQDNVANLAGLFNGESLTLIDNYRIATDGSQVEVDGNNNPVKVMTTNYMCYYGECTNNKYKLTASGGQSSRLWAFADASWNIISKADENTSAADKILIPPATAKYIVINNDKRNIASPSVIRLYDAYEEISDINTELAAARVDAAGVTQSSLDARLDSDNAAINTQINGVKSDVSAITSLIGGNQLSLLYAKCIQTNGSTIAVENNVPVMASKDNWKCFYDDCTNKKYKVTGTGGNDYRLWAFADSSWNIISVANAGAEETAKLLVPPTNAKYVVVNVRIDHTYSLIAVDDVYSEVNNIASLLDGHSVALIDNYRITTNGATVDVDENNKPVLINTGNYKCFYEDCTNKKYRITGKGATESRLWAFADASWNILSAANSEISAKNEILFPPSNAKYVIFNVNKTNAYNVDRLNDKINLKVLTYNTGDYSGTGYTAGSADLAIEYRRAVAASSPELVIAQEDVAYYNSQQHSLSRDEVFGMFNFYQRKGSSSYNYKSFASKYYIDNVQTVNYQTPDVAHTYFMTGDLVIDGITIKIVNVHFDWQDVTRRSSQIDEVIAYCNDYPYVIVGGDFNPSVRVNGEFPDGTSPYDNFFNYADYDKWTNAGYKVANAGYYGGYNTDLSYPAPTNKSWTNDKSDFACWDNIVVSGNINIMNVGKVISDYMNDHAPFWAELEINI